MPFVDQSSPDPQAQGGALIRQKMLDAGAPQPQVDAFIATKRQQMLDAGAPLDKVNTFWGINKPDPAPVQEALHSQIEPYTHVAGNPWEAWVSGLQEGNMGLAATSGKPGVTPNPAAGPLDKTLETAGLLVSNAPSMIEGGVSGAIAGIPGGIGGMATGASMGANMWPAALREMLLKRYNTTGPFTAQDVMATGLSAASEASKAGIATVVGEGAGNVVASQMEKLPGFDAAISKLSGLLAGGAATTETQAVLNGHLAPSADDFISGAVLSMGMAAGHYIGTGSSKRFAPTPQGADVVQNLQDIYQRTGMTPDEVTRLAQTDNQVKQEMFRSRTAGGDQITPAIDSYAASLGRATGKTFAPEPTSPFEPLKPEAGKAGDYKFTPAGSPIDPTTGQEMKVSDSRYKAAAAQFGQAQNDPSRIVPVIDPLAAPTTAQSPVVTPEQVSDHQLQIFKTLEGSTSDAVSPAGAIGDYQIMPATARQYGFDPALLKDPAYNERAARAILADLNNRFKGNLADMAVAYNAGPGRAQAWIRGGRDFYSLPLETQKYLLHAEKIGAIDSGFTATAARADLTDDQVVSRAGDTPVGEAPEVKPPSPDEAPPLEGGPLSKEQSDAEFAKMRGTVEPPPGWGSKLNLGEVWRGFQFQLTPAHGFDQAAGLGVKRVGTEDVLRSTLGTNGQADQFYTHGPVNLTFNEHGEPVFNPTQGPNFIDAYKLVGKSGGNIRDFDNYRIALRTLEKAEQGVKTGISPEAAKAQVNAPGAFEKYDAAHRMLQQAWDGVNKYSIASGMMSPERVAAMNALNEEYVPLNRLMDDKYTPPKWGGLFGIKQNYKVMEGSDRPFVPPAIAEMDNVNARVRAATRNMAVKFTIDRLREIDPKLATMVKIAKGTGVKEVREAMAALKGEDGEALPDDAKAAIEPELTAKEVMASLQKQGKVNPDTDVAIFRNGEPEVWRIHDPEIAKMIKQSTGGPDDPLPGLFGAFGRLATSGIVSAPTFPFRALWHAAITAPLYSEGGTQVPFGDMLYGTIASIAGDKIGGEFKGAYERYAANGGIGGTFNEVNRNMIEPRLRDVMNGKPDPTTGVVNVVHHPLEALRIMQHMVHNSMQVGAMIASEQRGQPTLRAAMLARKAGLDYAEKFNSPAVNTFMRAVPFGSTGFKDIQQVTQGFSDHPLATGIKVAAYLTLPTVVLTLANRMADRSLPDNEKYANKPQWEKDAYWIFPPMANGVRLRLPKPYVGGAMFASMPERIVNALWDQAHGDSHQAGLDMENWATSMITRMTPSYMPTLITPVAEQATNHSFFLNRPLVPDSQAKLSGDMQYGANTSSTSKAVAKFLSDQHAAIFNAHLDRTSPIVLDNYVSQWTGTAGSALWHGLGQVLVPEKANAPKEISDNPFWGSFFSRHQEAPEIINTFYDRLGQVAAAKADLAKAVKEGDQAAIAKKQGNPLLTVNISAAAKALANMRGFVNAINKSNMTDAEKLTQTDAISNQMIAVANAYVKQVDQISATPAIAK